MRPYARTGARRAVISAAAGTVVPPTHTHTPAAGPRPCARSVALYWGFGLLARNAPMAGRPDRSEPCVASTAHDSSRNRSIISSRSTATYRGEPLPAPFPSPNCLASAPFSLGPRSCNESRAPLLCFFPWCFALLPAELDACWNSRPRWRSRVVRCSSHRALIQRTTSGRGVLNCRLRACRVRQSS